MQDRRYTGNERRRQPAALDQARLEELALAYVARFATSAAKLERYLVRKLRERGWDGEGQPETKAVADRFVELGYIDDMAFARSKSAGLLRRGYGQRRVRQSLDEAGIAADVQGAVVAGEAERRSAALAMARKRGFGPFGPEPADRARREKQIAAMLRAGHPLDFAREMVDAGSIEAAELWAAEPDRDGES